MKERPLRSLLLAVACFLPVALAAETEVFEPVGSRPDTALEMKARPGGITVLSVKMPLAYCSYAVGNEPVSAGEGRRRRYLLEPGPGCVLEMSVYKNSAPGWNHLGELWGVLWIELPETLVVGGEYEPRTVFRNIGWPAVETVRSRITDVSRTSANLRARVSVEFEDTSFSIKTAFARVTPAPEDVSARGTNEPD